MLGLAWLTREAMERIEQLVLAVYNHETYLNHDTLLHSG